MTNREVFKKYNTETWVIEQNLCFMLQEYWEQYGKKACEQAKNGYMSREMPFNPVTFVKQFMKEETICNVNMAEKSKDDTIQKSVVIETDAKEV